MAKKYDCKILFSSTSEVYGDPECPVQKESYRGKRNNERERKKDCYKERKSDCYKEREKELWSRECPNTKRILQRYKKEDRKKYTLCNRIRPCYEGKRVAESLMFDYDDFIILLSYYIILSSIFPFLLFLLSY